jgi:uncharacterized protein YdiU (UPF0061 family)
MQAPIYELGPEFYDDVSAAHFPKAVLRYRNQSAAEDLNLHNLSDSEWKNHFWEFQSLAGNIHRPLALRYHGHQFQSYNPDLGDGRGFLFAQIFKDKIPYDLGTKGSGKTPYSRGGDGRLTLKGAFREILATELLESYGVHTSKTLSVFETGESLSRNDEPSPTRAGVLVRVCKSHVRFGSFQRLAFLKQNENIEKLLNYSVKYFYPELEVFNGAEKAAAFLQSVCRQHAKTVAQWMMCGFVHGVLNTDNMNITGETFDFGPYRFLPKYDPSFTAAYFDQSGMYCFGRQPSAILWNLYRLGESLRQAFPTLPVQELLEDYGDEFNMQVQAQLLSRLNLKPRATDITIAHEHTGELVAKFFQFQENSKGVFEQIFFDLHSGISNNRLNRSPQSTIYQGVEFENLKAQLENFEISNLEKSKHAYFIQNKACTVLIDELENIWHHIATNDDWTAFENKLKQIRSIRGIY